MRRLLLSCLALVVIVAGAVTASADEPVVEVSTPDTLPADVGFVRDVGSSDELHAVLWTGDPAAPWELTLTSSTGTELRRALDLFEIGEAFATERDVAVGTSGALVARVSDGVLGLQHVGGDGTVAPVVRNLAGDDAVVTEVEVEAFHDRFLVTWVEADATDAAVMQVMSRTYGADGSLGPVRPLSEVTPGESVGALRSAWHPGRDEALVIWFEGTEGAFAPIRSRRVVSETIVTRELPTNGLGIPASGTGERWNVRTLVTVHGPSEWLIESRVTTCGGPCTARTSPLTFATHGDLPGPLFDGGRPDRVQWESTALLGSVEGPTLLIEQESFPADGPASIRSLVPGSSTFELLPETIPLGPRFGVFELSAFDGRYRLVLQRTISFEPLSVDLTFPEPTAATTTPPTTPTPSPPTSPEPAPAPVESEPTGYWMVDAVGNVYPFGAAIDAGGIDDPADLAGEAIVDIEPTTSGDGYWVLLSDQQIRAFGDATIFHSGNDLEPGESATSMSATPDGGGYWIFTDRGRALAYGTATHHGDMAGVALNGPVVGSIATPSGEGYFMVASDGGIFAFGDAEFRGSMGGTPLNGPVVGLAPTPSGDGYWLVATDGGIFAFGDAEFSGSMGSTPLNRPVNGMVAYGGGSAAAGGAAGSGAGSSSDATDAPSVTSDPPETNAGPTPETTAVPVAGVEDCVAGLYVIDSGGFVSQIEDLGFDDVGGSATWEGGTYAVEFASDGTYTATRTGWTIRLTAPEGSLIATFDGDQTGTWAVVGDAIDVAETSDSSTMAVSAEIDGQVVPMPGAPAGAGAGASIGGSGSVTCDGAGMVITVDGIATSFERVG